MHPKRVSDRTDHSSLPFLSPPRRHDEIDAEIKPNGVERDQNEHPAPCRSDDRVPQPCPPAPAVFVEVEKHGEGEDEVNSIKEGADCVRHVPVGERVVRERRDGQRLHEGREIRKGQDDHDEEGRSRAGGREDHVDVTKHCVAERVVKVEVENGGEVHANRDVVETHADKSVGRLEHAIEVVSVPVVADEAEHDQKESGAGAIL